MISLCIKTNNPETIKYLQSNIATIDMDNIIYSSKTFSKYKNITIHYTGQNTSKFYDEIANTLCKCILNIYEPKLIEETININYFYFDYSDIEQINQNCIELLSCSCFSNTNKHFGICNTNMSYKDEDFESRKVCLWTDILKYITSNKSILLDGFIRFRIKNYLEYLDNAVDTSVNQFVIDKEYADFIDLVKLYIDSKSPLTESINLVYSNGESIISDSNNNIITTTSKKDANINYISDISFASNDYTLDLLLSLLPQSIKVKLISPEDEFINTLKLIFGNRLSIITS